MLSLLVVVWLGRSAVATWTVAKSHGLVLLMPDTSALNHPVAQAWIDAANEEGLSVNVMTSNRFVQAVARQEEILGVLVPDTVHQHASEIWVQALKTYVRRGGHALLSFDAAIFNLDQEHYAAAASRLSDLVGYRYALYESLQHETTTVTPVHASREAVHHLGIQPGKVDFGSSQSQTLSGNWGELTTYGYEHLMYPHFRTAGPYEAQVWIRSVAGDPVLSLHAYEKGSVLFANLPLGYLKTRTDAYLLHRLLAYFNQDLLHQPSLSAAPEGVGGLVLNLHLDSNAAERPVLDLENAGFFEHGPFSIHITAGPDSFRSGDRLGLDMVNNQRMQSLLRRLHRRGHEIGNHGGWIHNVFGEQADEDNAALFLPWLELNQKTLSGIVGQSLMSYSAPMGNQPDWVTSWLQTQGFRGYYTAGDSGMGPTRAYRNGQPPATSVPWAFPISNLRRIATFEELQEIGASESTMSEFVRDLMLHVSERGIVRLFYFHPASAKDYPDSLRMLQRTALELQAQQVFRWYTMQGLADFLDRRRDVRWQIQTLPGTDRAGLQAQSHRSLQGMTWVFPKDGVRDLKISEGHAQIIEDAHSWRVIADDFYRLAMYWRIVRK